MRLISNRFIYLFSILCKDFLILCKNCEKIIIIIIIIIIIKIKKVVVIRFSHRIQCLITTNVDIMFIILTAKYYV